MFNTATYTEKGIGLNWVNPATVRRGKMALASYLKENSGSSVLSEKDTAIQSEAFAGFTAYAPVPPYIPSVEQTGVSSADILANAVEAKAARSQRAQETPQKNDEKLSLKEDRMPTVEEFTKTLEDIAEEFPKALQINIQTADDLTITAPTIPNLQEKRAEEEIIPNKRPQEETGEKKNPFRDNEGLRHMNEKLTQMREVIGLFKELPKETQKKLMEQALTTDKEKSVPTLKKANETLKDIKHLEKQKSIPGVSNGHKKQIDDRKKKLVLEKGTNILEKLDSFVKSVKKIQTEDLGKKGTKAETKPTETNIGDGAQTDAKPASNKTTIGATTISSLTGNIR